jgi:hypothetical protein
MLCNFKFPIFVRSGCLDGVSLAFVLLVWKSCNGKIMLMGVCLYRRDREKGNGVAAVKQRRHRSKGCGGCFCVIFISRYFRSHPLKNLTATCHPSVEKLEEKEDKEMEWIWTHIQD